MQRGLRLTEHRRIVLEVLEGADDHPCVREIHRRAADGHRIGIATVYRTLNTLVEAGMVKRQVFPDGKAHYERAGRLAHPHLIDVATGRSSRSMRRTCTRCSKKRRGGSVTVWSTTA